MKTRRSGIVLHMSFLLKEKGKFTEKQIREDLDISRSSFFRALSDFRCYLAENRCFDELVYDSDKSEYYLAYKAKEQK